MTSKRDMVVTDQTGDASCTSGFGTHARTVAAPMRNAVLVDLMRRKRVSKDKCLELLRAHVKQNVWQVSTKRAHFVLFGDSGDLLYLSRARADDADGRTAAPPTTGHPARVQSQLAAVFILLCGHGAGSPGLFGRTGYGQCHPLRGHRTSQGALRPTELTDGRGSCGTLTTSSSSRPRATSPSGSCIA